METLQKINLKKIEKNFEKRTLLNKQKTKDMKIKAFKKVMTGTNEILRN